MLESFLTGLSITTLSKGLLSSTGGVLDLLSSTGGVVGVVVLFVFGAGFHPDVELFEGVGFVSVVVVFVLPVCVLVELLPITSC